MQARYVMVSPVITVGKIATVRDVATVLLENRISGVPVVEELGKQSSAHTHNLGVTVTSGIVDLWGYAESDDQRKAIRVLAEAIPGVTLVNDHLTDSSTIVY